MHISNIICIFVIKNYKDMNKEEQIKLIIEKNPLLSAREIGKKLNLNRQTIIYYLHKLNILLILLYI